MVRLPGNGRQAIWLAVLAFFPSAARADEVQFDTVDKVELKGTFYPASKKSACVLLLHKFGGNRQQKGWDELAQALNKAGYAVLGFDFRGHGDSTSVQSGFWRYGQNVSMIKGGARMPSKISYKDFSTSYLPYLVNDVAAAKRYLEQQNDAGACNASNIVVVGAEEGAGVGALWMATEWGHSRMTKNPFGVPVRDPSGKLESDDLAAAIWLSIPQKLGTTDVASWVRGPANKNRDKIPMVFFFGDKDTKAAHAAQSLYGMLKNAGRGKLEYTRLVHKDTKLAGAELLGKKGFQTEENIVNYLDNIMQKRGLKTWVQRDVDKSVAVLVPLQGWIR